MAEECELCGAPRRAGARFCSRVCAARAAARVAGDRRTTTAAPATRVCLHCGADMEKRSGEHANKFVRRRYCTAACATAAGRRRKFIDVYGVMLTVREVAMLV